ncbi:MAG: transglutaminase-like cysteine peptidase [Rhodospirillales bacterium]|nr:transglutaminase-like cysteine peptidase [Rhodospirillales bacterium]
MRRRRVRPGRRLFRSLLLAALLAAIPLAALAQESAAPAAAPVAPEAAPYSAKAPAGPRVLDGGFRAGQVYAGFWTAMARRHAGGALPSVWQDLLGTLEDTPAPELLARINRAVNRVAYRDDRDNWGEVDYWAAPGEFLARGGDCEDYAIAKYYALKALGYPVAQLRLMVLWDEERDIAHAVLAVGPAGDALVLDNVRDEILPLRALPHYRVHYSLNDDTVLRHLASR